MNGELIAAGTRQELKDVKRYLVAVVIIVSGGALVRALQPVTVSVHPQVTSGSAQVRVRVEPNEMNRRLVWEVDGSDYYRSSSIQIEGASAPRTWFFTIRDLPEGEYDVRATIIRNIHNSESMARTTIVVVSRGAPARP